jgi:hypothetical protein
MSSFNAEKEKRLAICLKSISENPRVKIATLARKHRVSYDKLRRRIRHVPDQRAKGGHNKRLNATQDKGLKGYMSYLIRIGQPPNQQGLQLAANRILQASKDTGKGCSTN